MLAEIKLNVIKVQSLRFKASIDSYINRKKFISVNNVLIKDNEMEEGIKKSKNSVEYTI